MGIEMLRQSNKIYEPVSVLLLVIVSLFIFTFRLDNVHVFTDEVIYIKSGYEIFSNNYYLSGSEIPMAGKYMAGLSGQIEQGNIFYARLPYALLAVLSSLLVYLIGRKQYGHKWGIIASILYICAPLIYKSSRMVMLESPLFFCWLLFHYFFLNYLESKKRVYTVLVAVSLGTALAFKLPTIVFYPFIFFMIIIKNYLDKSKILKLREVIDMAIMYLLSIVIFAGFYVPAYISHGISGINAIINQVLHEYINWGISATKTHLIADKVFIKSPWWTYAHYFYANYHVLHLILALISIPIAIFKTLTAKDYKGIYWMLCFAFNFTLMQALSIKNGERYAAEFELPLVFIMLYALHWITSLAKSRTYKMFLIAVILGFIVLSRIFYISQIKPTRFHALYNFIQQESGSFTPEDMIYIYPFSERSYNWYFDKNKNITNSSKDKYMYPEKPVYKYIFIDKEAKKRFPPGSRAKLFKYLKNQKEIYERKEDFEGFEMYMRNDEKVNIFIDEENPL